MAKIYNEVIIDMNPESPTFEKTIHEDSYEYNGDMMLAQEPGGIYMGGEKNIGFGKKQARDLAAFIKTQKEKFGEQSGKRSLWDKFGDVLQAGLSLTGVPGIVIGSIADWLIDTISSEVTMSGKKAGDVEGIKELETAYTGGGYGDEFEKMVGESKVDPWASFLENALEGIGTFAIGEGLDFAKGVKESGLKDTMARTFGIGGKKFGEKVTAQGIADMPWLEGGDSWSDFLSDPGATAGYAGDYMGFPFEKESDYPGMPTLFQQGGRVPKYYGGGMVQDEVPTISDYFNRQGKSLGGSNKQSLAEMLGRK